MMNNAEATNQTVPEALGSRKAHNSKELALNRRLAADIARQQIRPLAVASVDAAQCYDSIAHTPGSLACQRLGAPPLFLSCMLVTIQLMKFYLRTAFGDLDLFFGGGRHGLPFQGICQGNGGGPAFWYAVSVVLVLALYHRGHCAQYKSALLLEITTVAGLLFVDDTDLLAYADDESTTPTEVVDALQAAIRTWQGVLRATGGSLKPEKCSWGVLAFRYQGGKPRIRTPRDFPAELSLPTDLGAVLPIKRVSAADGVTCVE